MKKISYFLLLSLLGSASETMAIELDQKNIPFSRIMSYSDNINLSGVSNEEALQFNLRKDKIVNNATVHVEYIPSPALLPNMSQLMVYFNDDIIGVYPIAANQLGKKVTQDITINPLTVTTQNRLRFKFIGHYTDICENVLNTSIWLKVLRNSSIDLQMSDLPLQNDLSFLPLPFVENVNEANNINFFFNQSPNTKQQQAASVVASWFNVQAKRSKVNFHTHYQTLADDDAIVFVTNQNIPSFLNQHSKVTQPTIEMINHPTVATKKLLVFWGRDDNDLINLSKAFVTNNIQLVGAHAVLNKFVETGKRQAYDAPNWLPIDKPLRLGEIKTYSEQLTTTGFKLNPLSLYFRLPPDIFSLGKYSTSFDLKYRYTNPVSNDDSRVLMYINNQFYKSLRLGSNKDDTGNISLQVPIHQGIYTNNEAFKMPGIVPDRTNELRFDPYFMSVTPGGSKDQCVTYQPVANAFTVDDDSVIDFSKFAHYMKMPNLHAFVYSGFPFSKFADFSETMVVSPKAPTTQEMDLILTSVGMMSNKVGLPAYNIIFADASIDLAQQDKDLLVFQTVHQNKLNSQDFELKGNISDLNLPIENIFNQQIKESSTTKTLASIATQGNMGALMGYESRYFKQRSVVALIANDAQSLVRIKELLQDPNQTSIFGSLAVVRPSGVTSVFLDNEYSIGNLTLLQRIQLLISKNGVILGLITLLLVSVVGFTLVGIMKKYRKKRMGTHDDHQ